MKVRQKKALLRTPLLSILLLFALIIPWQKNIFINTTQASFAPYVWTVTPDGSGNNQADAIDVASDGSVYTTGHFYTTVDFDDTAGTDNHTSTGNADIFITKYNSDGTYAWTVTPGGASDDFGLGIVVASDGSAYATGYFSGTVDFDDTAGTDNHTSVGGKDIFITKYNSDGTYAWTVTPGGTSDDQGSAIALASDGNVYTTGIFSLTVDFDDTAGTDNHTSSGGNDIFITKYSSAGAYGWTVAPGGVTSNDQGLGIDIASDGSVYATGLFTTVADFDGTAGTDTHSSSGNKDFFITKYSSAGAYVWTVTPGGTLSDQGNGMVTASDGSIYVTGSFAGTVDFDDTAGTDNHTSEGQTDIFITKYSSAGAYVWTVTPGGTLSSGGNAIDIATDGSVYITGYLQGTVDFDDTAGTDNKTSAGGNDIFITKYNSDATYGWTKSFGGTSGDFGSGISVKGDGTVYLTGEYGGTVDFDSSSAGTDSHTSVGVGIFITKYNSENVFQISNLNSGLLAKDSSGNNIETGTENGLATSTSVVVIEESVTGRIISEITTDMTSDRSWSSVTGSNDINAGKSVVANLPSQLGTTATHTLYVPALAGHTGVVICPEATTLAEVTTGCTRATIKTESNSNISKVSVTQSITPSVTLLSESFTSVGIPPSSTTGTWTTGGTADWIRDISTFQSSPASASNGNIADDENSWIDLDITVGNNASLSFDWKVSSEDGFDYLLFCLNTDSCDLSSGSNSSISGDVDWVTLTVSLSSGANSLRWRYEKDGSADDGSDTGWIDNVTITSDDLAGAPTITYWKIPGVSGTGGLSYDSAGPVSASQDSPDFFKDQGGLSTKKNVSIMAKQGTISSDINMNVDIITKTLPLNIQGAWQISDIFIPWLSYHSDGLKVQPEHLDNPYTLILSYSDSDLLVHGQKHSYPVNSLNVFQSLDQGKTWTILPTVFNQENKTIAVVTKPDGYYVITASLLQTQNDTLGAQNFQVDSEVPKNQDTTPLTLVEPPAKPEDVNLNLEDRQQKKTILDFFQSLFRL